MANPKLFRLADKAVLEYSMIETNDKILLAASGGKDSTALAEYLAFRKKRTTFSVEALHISTELENADLTILKKLYEKFCIKLEIKEIKILERLKAGKKMNCWWCSSQRRAELLKYALEGGFNKIAFGHHIDDILETALMNIFTKARLFSMPPVLKLNKFPITIIRPLALADIPTIQNHVTQQGYISSTCTCNYQSNSHRKIARKQLAKLTDNKYALKLKLFTALKKENVILEYLH